MTRSQRRARGVPPKILVALAPPVTVGLGADLVALAPPVKRPLVVVSVTVVLAPPVLMLLPLLWQAIQWRRSPNGVHDSRSSDSDDVLHTNVHIIRPYFTLCGRPSRGSLTTVTNLTLDVGAPAAQKLS